MTKTIGPPLLLAVIFLIFPFFSASPFTLLVVDETGAPVPKLRVTDGNGMVWYTGEHGELIVWGSSSAPGPVQRFEIADETRQFASVVAFLEVIPCSRGTVAVRRLAYR
jgi:hypothetical protein